METNASLVPNALNGNSRRKLSKVLNFSELRKFRINHDISSISVAGLHRGPAVEVYYYA